MQKKAVGLFTEHVSFLAAFNTWLSQFAPHENLMTAKAELLVDQVPLFKQRIDRMIELAVELELPLVSKYARELKVAITAGMQQNGTCVLVGQNRANARAALMAISNHAGAELDTKIFFSIDARQVALYEPLEPHFGADVRGKFHSAIFDIDEASKCLALGRATACVFHLMRVVERALRAVHLCLGLTAPDNPSWGIWLKNIRVERVRRGDRQWPENDYFQDVYSSLDAIKDAQRDRTMHPEVIYTEEEARVLFDNTKLLMKKIAGRMDENGEPKA